MIGMEKTIKMVMVALILIMREGEATEDLENIVKGMQKEMRMEMNMVNSRLALTEEKLMKTQQELNLTQLELLELKTENVQLKERIKMTEEDQKNTKDDLTATKEDLINTKEDVYVTKEDLLNTKDYLTVTKEELLNTKEDLTVTKEDLINTKENLKTKEQELELEISILKEPPFFHACGYQSNSISITLQTISYSSLLYSNTNIPGGDLDISTGVFTCPYPGSYTVTWSLMAWDNAGETYVAIYLRKNGQNLEESYHSSEYTGSSGAVRDQGGRTMVLHLDRGDTLDLYCQNCSAGIYRTLFCVSLSTFDIE